MRLLLLCLLLLTLVLSLSSAAGSSPAADGNISNTAGDSRQPALVVSTDDTRIVAWEEEGEQVFTAVEGDVGWLVTPLAQGLGPALAAAPGAVHLAYADDDGTGNTEIYHSRWTDDTWTPPQNVSLTSGASMSPDVAVAPAATPHFVWTDMTPGEPTVYHGTPDAASPIFNARGVAPAITIDADGEIHVVWQASDDETGLAEIFYLHGDGTTWSFAENLSASPDVDSLAPSIVAGPDGTVHVAWNEGGRAVVRSGRFLGFSPAILVSGSRTGVGSIDVVSDAAGNLFVAWDEASRQVRLAGERAGTTTWSEPITIAEAQPWLGDVALIASQPGVVYVAWAAPPTAEAASDVFVTTGRLLGADYTVLLPAIMRRLSR